VGGLSFQPARLQDAKIQLQAQSTKHNSQSRHCEPAQRKLLEVSVASKAKKKKKKMDIIAT